MESPERSECISAPVDQGSPFFKYLCGLSPIKPARSVHVVQTYAELSLPPPPAVFTSPANPHKCGGRSKRGLVVSRTASTQVTVEAVGISGNKWGGGKENQPNQSYIPKSYVAQFDACHVSSYASSEHTRQQSLCPKLEQEQGTTSRVDTPTKFECGDVAAYLADPSEGGLYTTASSSQLVAKSYVHRVSPSSEEYGYHEDEHHNCAAANEGRLLDGAHCLDDATHVAQRNFNTIRGSDLKCHQISDLMKTETRESVVFLASGSGSDHEGSRKSGAELLACVDQETAAMAFLLAGDTDGEGANRNDWVTSQSALSEISRQETPDFSAIERLSNLAQLEARENFEVATFETLEKQRNADADEQLEDRKDVLVGGTGGQRGVRRRCLDFETSVRRKSTGCVSSRKCSGLRSKNPVSSGMTSVSCIPPSVLCERAVATSDATNSVAATSRALDSHTDVSLRPECTSSASRGLSPGLVRISRCTVQGNADLMSTDQYSTDLTRAGSDCNNTSSSVGIPSGIGLHLNSLTGSISFSPTNRDFKQAMGLTSTSKGAVASLLGMPGLLRSNSDNRSEEFVKSTLGLGARSNSFSMAPATSNFGTGVVISVMERSRLTLRKSLPVTDMTKATVKTGTLQSLAVGARQSLDESLSSRDNGIEKKFVAGGKKRLSPQGVLHQTNLDYADEYDSPRSQKKRRKSPSASGERPGEGCKRCNCKKSKCLKLYCECFAAGTYCVGSCTCHDCFNKPEHEDTVLNTRHQIESRNPLAFAPKIVHSGDASPKRGEEVIETPRHKRGCNCKKSLCLKKYCECYQAGVGCSEGCRCEGCKNMYGRNEAIEDSDDKETSDFVESGSMEGELEMTRIGSYPGVGNIDQNRNNSKDLSPITPSFLYTGQGRTTGRVRSVGKKRSSSPLSNSNSIAKLPRSPGCATRSSVKFQSNNNAQQTPQIQHLRGVYSPIATPKLSRVNQLSPRWDGLGDICTLTPLPQPPLRPTPASISTLGRAGSSPCFSCQSIEPVSSYQPDKLDSVSKSSPPASQRASDHSPLSSFESRIAHSSCDYPMPCTAALSSSTYAGSDNVKAGNARSSRISFLCDDSDTPDFLKYTDSTNSPVITKSGSPKQKRVSPPHVEGMRDRTRDGRVVFDSPARSSPGLRSGRKFILQALPSLPPVMSLTHSQNQVSNSPNQV